MVNISEKAQHIADSVVVPLGAGAMLHEILEYTGHLVESLINPLLTSAVLITTAIWTVYRALEIRDSRRRDREEREAKAKRETEE